MSLYHIIILNAIFRYYVKSSYYRSNNKVEDHLLFKIDNNSQIIQKYSHKYNHKDNYLVYLMSSGPIRCVNEYNVLINAYRALPLIEIYNTEKNNNINYRLLDVNPYKYEFQKTTLRPSNINLGTSYHKSGNLLILQKRFVIVQFYEIDQPDKNTKFINKVLSYIFDLKNSSIYYSYELPYIRAISFDKLFVKDHTKESIYSLHNYELGKN